MLYAYNVYIKEYSIRGGAVLSGEGLKKSDLTSEKCPYNCVNGVIFHPRRHVETQCPHCAEMRKSKVYSISASQVDDESIEKKLGIQERVCGKADYSFEALFREGIDKFEPASVTAVKEELDRLVSNLSLNELPSYSMMFNLGSRVFEENFVNPLLVRGYLAGLNVAPLLTVHKIAELRYKSESQDYSISDARDAYSALLEADLCVVALDEGITRSGIDLVKGFVYARGREHKPSVLLTHSSVKELFMNFATEDTDFDYCVPKLVQVRYKKKGTFRSDESLASDVVSTDVQYSRSSFSALSASRDFM